MIHCGRTTNNELSICIYCASLSVGLHPQGRNHSRLKGRTSVHSSAFKSVARCVYRVSIAFFKGFRKFPLVLPNPLMFTNSGKFWLVVIRKFNIAVLQMEKRTWPVYRFEVDIAPTSPRTRLIAYLLPSGKRLHSY